MHFKLYSELVQRHAHAFESVCSLSGFASVFIFAYLSWIPRISELSAPFAGFVPAGFLNSNAFELI